jgi:hypothetical protein
MRSAFGSFVAETTFISNCNLMLEGPSDQVLLAGMSARPRRQRTSTIDNLDLNTVTLVPAGPLSRSPIWSTWPEGETLIGRRWSSSLMATRKQTRPSSS